MKRLVTYLFILLITSAVAMAQTRIGSAIGSFSIETGDGKQMVSSDLSGCLTVLFNKNEVYVVIIDHQSTICFFEKEQLNQRKIDQAVNILLSQLHRNE